MRVRVIPERARRVRLWRLAVSLPLASLDIAQAELVVRLAGRFVIAQRVKLLGCALKRARRVGTELLTAPKVGLTQDPQDDVVGVCAVGVAARTDVQAMCVQVGDPDRVDTVGVLTETEILAVVAECRCFLLGLVEDGL